MRRPPWPRIERERTLWLGYYGDRVGTMRRPPGESAEKVESYRQSSCTWPIGIIEILGVTVISGQVLGRAESLTYRSRSA